MNAKKSVSTSTLKSDCKRVDPRKVAACECDDLVEPMDAELRGIARGERAIAEGRIATHALARERLARWLK
jgi:predicted transcriptional regulator